MPKYILAVTGNPVLHSKSPFIFNTLFSSMKIDAFYTRLAASSGKEAIDLFNNLNLKGMNVTAPFKEEIMQYLDEMSYDAEIIGGVNTIVRQHDKLTGYNTDFIGVYQSFLKQGVVLKNKKAVVIGAGGAGRAACYGLMQNNVDVTIVNRTLSKAIEASRKLKCGYAGLDDLKDLLKETDIIVSSLSQNIDVIDEAWIKPSHIVFDANYKSSRLVEKSRNKGCTIIKGESWLLNQALPAFEHFFNTKPDKLELNNVLENNLNSNKKNIIIISSEKKIDYSELSKKINYEIIDLENINANISNKIIITDINTFNKNKINQLQNNALYILIYNKKILNEKINEHIDNIHLVINGDNKTNNIILDNIYNELKIIL